MSDSDLLRQFVEDRSERAFAELVRRRIDFVYSAALRQLAGDTHRAQDVTQEVFIALARKGRSLLHHPELLGWFYSATHFAAVNAIRREQRRRQREEEAHAMHDPTHAADAAANWLRLRPVLDRAMHELSERDRQIVLLRYFDHQSFAAIGATLGLTDNAVQKSAERALDRLHAALSRRGITSTAAGLGIVLGAEIATAAPAGLAAHIVSSALASSAATATTGVLALMTASKTVLIVAGVATAVAIGFIVREKKIASAARLATEAAQAQQAVTRAVLAQAQAQLASTNARAQAAEEDSAKLLQAVSDVRAAQPAPTTPQKKDYSTLSRAEALAEAAAMVDKTEAQARSTPGYKPYQPPDESQLSPYQREYLERNRAHAKAGNSHIFAEFGTSKEGFPLSLVANVPPLVDGPLAKQLPQLTREDWLQFEERYARAMGEAALARDRARAEARLAEHRKTSPGLGK
jgi:RNA polymerase sigma factor (sigma-70 family)